MKQKHFHWSYRTNHGFYVIRLVINIRLYDWPKRIRKMSNHSLIELLSQVLSIVFRV